MTELKMLLFNKPTSENIGFEKRKVKGGFCDVMSIERTLPCTKDLIINCEELPISTNVLRNQVCDIQILTSYCHALIAYYEFFC